MTQPTDARLHWLAGLGPVQHRPQTIERIDTMVEALIRQGLVEREHTYRLLAAADRLTCAGMNVVAHMTYAQRIDLSGAPLAAGDFKATPEALPKSWGCGSTPCPCSNIALRVMSASEGSPAVSTARSVSYFMCERSKRPSRWRVEPGFTASNCALFQT